MVKAYLRYALSRSFGLVYSPGSNVVYVPHQTAGPLSVVSGSTGKRSLVAVGALEYVLIWDVKRGECLRQLPSPVADEDGGEEEAERGVLPVDIGAQVTRLHMVSDSVLAAGYSDGHVRLWSLHSFECTVAFNGHRKAVNCLATNEDGSLLVSGSADNNVIVWDTVAEQGLCRLKGHSDAVTQVLFLSRYNAVASASKDGFIKLWDMATQHCVQTLTGHRKEVWAVAVDAAQTRLVSGSVDDVLRVWRLTAVGDADSDPATKKRDRPTATTNDDDDDDDDDDDNNNKLAADADVRVGNVQAVFHGEVSRKCSGRVHTLAFSTPRRHDEPQLLACQSAGKEIEFFRVHSGADLTKRARKRRAKARQKQSGSQQQDAASSSTSDIVAADELAAYSVFRSGHKIGACAFSPHQPAFTLGLANNRIECYAFVESSTNGETKKQLSIQLPGHRSGVRGVALSHDDSMIASASDELLKVWSVRSAECVRSTKLPAQDGDGVAVAFLPGNRHVVVGTKTGALHLFDVSTGSCCYSDAAAHDNAVWSIVVRPDQKGMITGSADHTLKFWDFSLAVDGDGQRRIEFALTQTVTMAEDVMALAVTPRYVAVALLDYTIKVFHEDSMKFYLSLYGHKLPVLSHDISDDNALLVSGSADKNVKIWGLDFGDCHRSIFAHDGSVMQVKFVRQTHYFFSAGKDFVIKYWDADKFEHIMTLRGHYAEIWGLAVSRSGDLLVSASQDRSLRLWRRTDEQLFLEEEREREMDELFESTLASQRTGLEADQDALETATPGKRTLETIKAGEALLDAIALAQVELDLQSDYRAALVNAQETMPADQRPSDPTAPLLPPPPPSSAAFATQTPWQHVFQAVAAIPSAYLEEALLVLPFTSVVNFVPHLTDAIAADRNCELAMRCLMFLMRTHHAQITSTPRLVQPMIALQQTVRRVLQRHKDQIGYNMAAIKFSQTFIKDRSASAFRSLVSVPNPAPLNDDETKSSVRPKKSRKH